MLEREEINNDEMQKKINIEKLLDENRFRLDRHGDIINLIGIKYLKLNKKFILMSLFMCAQFVILLYVGFCTFYD